MPIVAACSDDGSPAGPDPDQPDPMSGPDTSPPVLNNFTFSPMSVDVTSQNQEVVIFADVIDEQSEIESVSVQWEDALGRAQINQFVVLPPADQGVHAGTQEGNFAGSLIVPQGSVGGTWTVLFVRFQDVEGNTATVPTDELRTRGHPVELEVR